MNKTNMKIREALREANMKQWQLADVLGVHEKTLCCKLRHELSEDEQSRIIELIRSNPV